MRPTSMVDNIDNRFGEGVSVDAGQEDDRSFPYRKLVGMLLHLSPQTRPDVTFTVNILRCFVGSPLLVRWSAVKHVLRDMAGTTNHEIMIEDGRGEENGQSRSILELSG